MATDLGNFACRNVVVATGTFGRTPHIPAVAADLDPAILQLHSSEYRRPGQISDGPVLVVGASHSGTDIAYELAETHPTILAGRDCGEIPPRLGSPAFRAVFPVLLFAWKHVLTRRSPMRSKLMGELRHHGGPMLRVKRRDLIERGVERVTSRIEEARDGLPVVDGTPREVATVVWATGFQQVFDWIHLPILGDDGWPREMRGVVPDVPGLFFCGLCFQYVVQLDGPSRRRPRCGVRRRTDRRPDPNRRTLGQWSRALTTSRVATGSPRTTRGPKSGSTASAPPSSTSSAPPRDWSVTTTT